MTKMGRLISRDWLGGKKPCFDGSLSGEEVDALRGKYIRRLTAVLIHHVPVFWKVALSVSSGKFAKAGEGEDNYICKIVEMFDGVDGTPYITAQWFYRAKDTVIKTCSNLVDDKRVFLSTIKDDNPLDCLLEKIKIVQLPLNVDLDTKLAAFSDADYYYDMIYNVPFSSFLNSQHDNVGDGNESDSTISSETNVPDFIIEMGC